MEDNDIQNPPDSNTNSSTKNFNLNQAGVDAAALAIQAVGQTIGGFVDIAQGFRAKRTASKAQDKANADLEKLMASQPSLSTPSEYYEAVKNAYDQRLLQMRNQDINYRSSCSAVWFKRSRSYYAGSTTSAISAWGGNYEATTATNGCVDESGSCEAARNPT